MAAEEPATAAACCACAHSRRFRVTPSTELRLRSGWSKVLEEQPEGASEGAVRETLDLGLGVLKSGALCELRDEVEELGEDEIAREHIFGMGPKKPAREQGGG